MKDVCKYLMDNKSGPTFKDKLLLNNVMRCVYDRVYRYINDDPIVSNFVKNSINSNNSTDDDVESNKDNNDNANTLWERNLLMEHGYYLEHSNSDKPMYGKLIIDTENRLLKML
jgi:hypothetical protein